MNSIYPIANLPKALENIEILLYIFSYLSVKDCLKCSLVCRLWCKTVRKHFRTQNQLIISYQNPSKWVTFDQHLVKFDPSPSPHPSSTILPLFTMTYKIFVQILTLFPSVKVVVLKNHPINDIYLSILTVLLPKLQKLHLIFCWAHPYTKHLNNKFIQINKAETINLMRKCNIDHVCNLMPNRKLRIRLERIFEKLEKDGEYPEISLIYVSKSIFSTLSTCSSLTHLTLANLGLTDEATEVILKNLNQIQYLDVSMNDLIEGRCFRYLGHSCHTLCTGAYNLQVSLADLMAGISDSNCSQLYHLELTGCLSSPIKQFYRMKQLRCLVMRFYVNDYDQHSPLASISCLCNLEILVLHQEFCYDELSIVEHNLLCDIAINCKQLKKLEILGEYSWKLQLNDCSLLTLSTNALKLCHLALTGNSKLVTDKGIMSLAQLVKLETLMLTSFKNITDKSIKHLIVQLKNLNNLCLQDNPSLTIEVLDGCIEAAHADPDRTLNIYIDDEAKMSSSKSSISNAISCILKLWHDTIHMISSILRRNISKANNSDKRWPHNLNVMMNQNRRSYRFDGDDLTLTRLLTFWGAFLMACSVSVTFLAATTVLPAFVIALIIYDSFKFFY